MRQRESDLALLRSILSPANEPEFSAYERVAFAGMLENLTSANISRLSNSQRQWANDVSARLKPLDSQKVLRGREVPAPSILQNLPKSPPKRVT
jgi:hypothetical protein